MQQVTTYRANGKTSGLVFLFKYDLNGNLKAFEIIEGTLDDVQMSWLYSGHFPATELIMQQNWCKLEKYKSKFQIDKSLPDLSFDALWELYGYKFSKLDAEKAFKKMQKNEADVIKCFIAVPKYLKHLRPIQVPLKPGLQCPLRTFRPLQYRYTASEIHFERAIVPKL